MLFVLTEESSSVKKTKGFLYSVIDSSSPAQQATEKVFPVSPPPQNKVQFHFLLAHLLLSKSDLFGFPFTQELLQILNNSSM